MARPLSEDKKNAILEAAIEVIAAEGVSAPTAKIARKAGVAEGTLFTYFSSKDKLINTLYIALKTELGAAINRDYPADKNIKERSRHLWNSYIGWGAADPLKHQALRQLAVSERVTEQSRKAGQQCMAGLRETLAKAGGEDELPFVSAIMGALADTTLDFIARQPRKARHYAELGFEAFWRAAGG